MSGDPGSDGRATLWAHGSRACAVEFEVGRPGGPALRRFEAAIRPETGLTARVSLDGLPLDEALWYRARARADAGVDAAADLQGRNGAPLEGRLRLPERAPRFVFGGDLCGQGYGIDPARGGFRIFDAMRALDPDFFLCSGDIVYADGPLPSERTLDDGTVWRNVVTPAKSKVAESLDDFRGQYRYNLLDDPFRRFLAEVPIVAQWDDHETTNNWYPGERLADERYGERSVDRLSARARRAFLEYLPLRTAPEGVVHRRLPYGPHLELFVLDQRSHRAPNGANDQQRLDSDAALLGPEQLAWLIESLRASKATFKIIAADMPIGLVIRDGPEAFEGIANGRAALRGREHEMAALLRGVRDVPGIVFLTADVHYCAAHRYDPARAVFRDFTPFWEFVAGPLHAGTFGPGELDGTFGPRAEFRGIPDGMKPNRPPSEGLQFFGLAEVVDGGRALAVSLHDVEGRELYRTEVPA